ncbi:actin cytoskeleton-regulatory complex protein [Salix suchowensis]|nr:actin cytoskeleton-regulatory complex protein [Salix suchowensis]
MANNTDLFDTYFRRADLDGDGQISGAEAVGFFQGSSLPQQVLAQVWMHADQRKAGYLGRQEFYNALKLVTVAQSKRELTPEIVKAALYGPASAKIPAPQINLAATPAPKTMAPAPQLAGTTPASSPNVGIRPPQVPGNAAINQQYFPSQQGQFTRQPQPQAMPPNSASHPQQILASQAMPRGGTVAAPRPLNSNISTDWLGGSAAGLTSQGPSRGVGHPATKDGFGNSVPGFTSSVQPRPQMTAGQMAALTPKPQEAAITSNQLATRDSKSVVVSGNGFASDSLFGDVFSATPAQPKQDSSPAVPSTSSISVSSALVPSAGSQPSVKPSSLDSLQSTFSQQQVGGQSTARPNQQVPPQSVTSAPSTGFSAGTSNAALSQSQPPWPRMTQSDIQKYTKVFVQVDTDRDGKLTGEQARNLFLSWRLPREVLKKVWDLSDQDNDSMLSLREFCTALYLMERYREGRPLPATLPTTVMSDETLLSATSHPAASYGAGSRGPVSGLRQQQVVSGARPPPAAAARPPRPPTAAHADEKQPTQQKPRVPVLEKHLVHQLSQEEQDALNSKFQEASQADKKVEELEKEIMDSRQKIEFYRVKMQELILYKSRCDNRLNEVTSRVSSDKHEVETLGNKYEEKYKQTGDVASKLTIEEATFRDIQEKKMDLYRAIVKMEEGGAADGVLKERSENIQSNLEELVKTVNERCKQYGLRSKPTSLVELPFGWQHGIQEGVADWDEVWDKFEDEGFIFVKELTLDVQNVVAPPKEKTSVRKATTSTEKDLGALPSNAEVKAEKVPSPIKSKDIADHQHENGSLRSPESPGRTTKENQSNEFQDSHSKKVVQTIHPMLKGPKVCLIMIFTVFDIPYDSESVWGFDSVSGKDMDFGISEFGLNPIKTGSSHGDNMSLGKTPFTFDSFPSTLLITRGTAPIFLQILFCSSTPAYNFGNSPRRLSEGSEDHAFDSFSRFDSFNMHDGGLFQSPRHSLSRFDSAAAPRTLIKVMDSHSDQVMSSHGFDFSRESDQNHGFSRFDSFKESDPGHGISSFDSFKESDPGHGFSSSFSSFGESRDPDPSHGFSNMDSFNSMTAGSSNLLTNSENSHGFPSFDDAIPFGSSGPFRASLESETPRGGSDNWRAF